MKYKYLKDDVICISSDNNIITVKKNDIVELTEEDIKYINLNNFEEQKEVKNKKSKEE